jgi:hypothetical protein
MDKLHVYVFAQHEPGGETTHGDDELGMNLSDLFEQPGGAGIDLFSLRVPVARWTTFHHISNITGRALDTVTAEQMVHFAASNAHEREAHSVLITARSFTDDHNGSVGRTITPDHLLAALSEVTPSAVIS